MRCFLLEVGEEVEAAFPEAEWEGEEGGNLRAFDLVVDAFLVQVFLEGKPAFVMSHLEVGGQPFDLHDVEALARRAFLVDEVAPVEGLEDEIGVPGVDDKAGIGALSFLAAALKDIQGHAKGKSGRHKDGEGPPPPVAGERGKERQNDRKESEGPK